VTEILDLNALAPERETARLRWAEDEEGTLYELLAPQDLGAIELAELTRLFQNHDELWEKDTRTKAEDKRLVILLDTLAQRLIPDAPLEAVAALPALTKRGLAVRFFVSAGLATAPTMAGLESRLTNSSLAS
jgi:hypothetical protein